MTVDESTITTALHDATTPLTADSELVMRVREGGSRRLRRRRIGATVGAIAVVAALIPAAISLMPGPSHREVVKVSRGRHGLYRPPATCNIANSSASPAQYPQLLMLPPGQNVTAAYTDTHPAGCPPTHVALTLLHSSGGTVTRGVDVQGPDAPSAAEEGYSTSDHSSGSDFAGAVLHPQVDGRTATVYYFKGSANVFWSGDRGDQWYIRSRGVGLSALNALLARLQFDARAGTATLPDAAAEGWTVAPRAPDAAHDLSGWFVGQWRPPGCPASETARCQISLTVRPGPDRTDQTAAALPDSRFVTVQGHPAVLAFGGTYLVWQPSRGVTAELAVSHRNADLIQQIANRIVPISPTDPRLHRP